MVTRLPLTVALVVVSAGMLGTVRPADAHPMHSSITELTLDPARGVVRATVRVFVDDLRTAVAHKMPTRALPADGPAWDLAVVAYATSAVALRDARGRPLTLRSCGSRRTGALLWLCLEADVRRDAGVLQVRNAMLHDLYADQINVVQAVVSGARRSLLFMRGDRFKPLQ